jgi:hypothetical protein
VPFEVSAAVSLSGVLVRVDFTAPLDLTHAANFNPVNYTIAGLTVLDVDPAGSSSVILHTSTQDSVSYVVVVNATPGRIQAIGADFLDPEHAEAPFDGALIAASFTAAAQSERKVRLQFSEPMAIDAEFTDPANYQLTRLDGHVVPVNSVGQTGPDDTRAQLMLDEDLTPFVHYSVQLGPALRTEAGSAVRPDTALFQWKRSNARPIRLEIGRFTGEVSGGILGTPAGQVFFSPALGTSAANSVVEIESVSVCTRAYDVYTLPGTFGLTNPWLFTFPASSVGGTALLGAGGGILSGRALRLGLPAIALTDLQTDQFSTAEDGPAEGLLSEPIDITRASFLNDARWRTFPGIGASLGAFTTADNGTPIGPGPVSGPFAIA